MTPKASSLARIVISEEEGETNVTSEETDSKVRVNDSFGSGMSSSTVVNRTSLLADEDPSGVNLTTLEDPSNSLFAETSSNCCERDGKIKFGLIMLNGYTLLV